MPRSRSDKLVVATHKDVWIVPRECGLVKMLIQTESITADALCFRSADDCHCFARELLLLALQDECQTAAPSALADLARALIHRPNCINTERDDRAFN